MTTDLDGMFWQMMSPEEAEGLISGLGDELAKLLGVLYQIRSEIQEYAMGVTDAESVLLVIEQHVRKALTEHEEQP